MNSSKFRIGHGGGFIPPRRISSSWKVALLLALSACMIQGIGDVNDTSFRESWRTIGDQELGSGR